MQTSGPAYMPNAQYYGYYYFVPEPYGSVEDTGDANLPCYGENACSGPNNALYSSDGYLWQPAQGTRARPRAQPAGNLHSSAFLARPDGFGPKDCFQLAPNYVEASREVQWIGSPGSPPRSWPADNQSPATVTFEQIARTPRVDIPQTEASRLAPEPCSPVSSSPRSFSSSTSQRTSMSAPNSPIMASSSSAVASAATAEATAPRGSVSSSVVSDDYEHESVGAESLPIVSLGCGHWKCEICDTKFRRKQRVITHYWSKHGNVRLSCDGRCGERHCPKTFATRDSFDSHVKPVKVTCDGCGRILLKKNILRHRDQHCHP